MSIHTEQHSDTALEALMAIWRRRWKIAACVFAVAITAAVSFIYSLPSIYSATATVLVNSGQSNGDGSSNGSMQGVQLESVTEEVLSRNRLETIINRFNLYPELRKKASPETVLTRMRHDIRMERKLSDQRQQWGRDQTFAFTLSYQGWEPQTVAQVTNALVSSYVDETARMQNQQTAGSLDTLEAQLTAIRQKLSIQEQKITAFKSDHIGELPEQQQANLMTLQQLSAQLQQNSQAQAAAIQRREVLLKGMVDSGNASITQLEQEETNLLTRFTDKYPDVIQIHSEIAAKKQALSASRNSGNRNSVKAISPLEQEYDALGKELDAYKAEEMRLRNETETYRKWIQDVPLRAQQLQTLTEGYDETRSVYSALQRRFDEAHLVQSSSLAGYGHYRIIEPAVPPKDTSGPDRGRLVLMALIFSIGISAAFIFGVEQIDTSFHKVGELRFYTRVPVLASIPRIATKADTVWHKLQTGALALSILLVLLFLTQIFWLLGHGNENAVWLLTRHGA